MVNKAYILKSDGTHIELDHKPTYDEAVEIVGGYIEFAHCPHRVTLVVDEEGRLKGKPINKVATSLYTVSPIVGDVLVLEGWRSVA